VRRARPLLSRHIEKVVLTMNFRDGGRVRPLPVALRRCLAAHALAVGLLPAAVLQASGVPAPTQAFGEVPDGLLHLELVLNQVETGRLIVIEQRAGRLFALASRLREAGISVPATMPEEIALDAVAGLHSEYDQLRLRLLLDVPPGWLSGQVVSNREMPTRGKAMTSLGAVLNYDVYSADTDLADSHVAAWNELKIFGSKGSVSTTGQFRRTFGTPVAGGSRSGYRRYDTTWRFSDDDRMLSYEAGDLISGALPWSSPVRLGGFQLSRDFSVRPDLVTYPLPQFAGETAVPTSLDLFVNGYKSSSTELKPGPYTLTNIPFINGAGEAVVVTTDALGRQVSTTLPFYVTSSLLQAGLTDFSIAAGRLRKDYAVRDFSYGTGVATGTLRYGVSDFFTLESHVETARDLTLAGVGGNLRVANLGVINSAVSRSRLDGRSGQQLSLGYQYNNPRYSITYQRLHRQADYADLTSIDSPSVSLSRRSEQATASLTLGSWGSMGMGYFDIRARDDSRTRLVNMSWSRSLFGRSSFYLSGNRGIDDGAWALQAQVMVPLGSRSYLTTRLERDPMGGNRQRVNLSQSVPTDGGLGYNLGYAHGGEQDYRQADVTWRRRAYQLQAGIYGSRDAETRWADLGGSAVLMDGEIFAGNRVDDAFVVVSTGGYAGIPVRYENQPVGYTGKGGRLLVPWSSAYYSAKYEIDPLNLPANIRSPRVEAHVMVRRGSGYLLEFPLTRSTAASVVLLDAQQQPLPLGASVRHIESGVTTVVGWEGLVYLENIGEDNHLKVTLPDGGTCEVVFPLRDNDQPVPRIDPQVCQ